LPKNPVRVGDVFVDELDLPALSSCWKGTPNLLIASIPPDSATESLGKASRFNAYENPGNYADLLVALTSLLTLGKYLLRETRNENSTTYLTETQHCGQRKLGKADRDLPPSGKCPKNQQHRIGEPPSSKSKGPSTAYESNL